MKQQIKIDEVTYHKAMGRLLAMYTQIDYLIMRAVAERIKTAPDDEARLFMARQVGDESRHVHIQKKWMQDFGTDPTPIFGEPQQEMFLQHFRQLNWLDFLTDMYVCVEALGSEAVEQVVPLADPGTRQSLKTPLQDEVEHVAFGLHQLGKELDKLSLADRTAYLETIEQRLNYLDDTFHEMGVDIPQMFRDVGADYQQVVCTVMTRRREILRSLGTPLAA